MTTGTIVEWKVKEGDHFRGGDLLARIETDKAQVDWEHGDDGYIAKLLVGEGQEAEVGQVLVILAEEEGDIAAFKDYKADGSSANSSEPAQEAPKRAEQEEEASSQSSNESSFPEHTILDMPALSPTMETGTLLKWNIKVGDKVQAGDIIAEIETDKAKVDWEHGDEGYVAKLLVEEGDVPKVGQPLVVLVEDPSDVDAFKSFSVSGGAKKSSPGPSKPAKQAPSKPAPQPSQPQAPQQAKSSPSAPSRPAPVATAGVLDDVDFTDLPSSELRQEIAQRVSEAKQTVPHYYLTTEFRVDHIQKLCAELNSRAKGAYTITLQDFVVKASARALQKLPAINATWNDKFIRRYNRVHINVNLNSISEGVYSPLIRDADRKGLLEISKTVSAFSEAAKESKLSSEDLQVGTFTISDLGSFGVQHSSSAVNTPQACLLTVGGVEKRLSPKKTPDAESPYEVASFVSCTLSCDHRVVDGAIGAQWLQEFKSSLEDPVNLLL